MANPGSANARDGLGHTPLHFAALAGQTNAARLLLAAGADPSARTRQFSPWWYNQAAGAAEATSLHYACQHDSAGIVQMLLKAGAPVGAADTDGNTPLESDEPSLDQWGKRERH